MTSYTVPIILFFSFSLTVVHGMDCSFGSSNNVLEQLISSCPRPIIDSSDKAFCCLNTDNKFYCCDAQEFALNTGLTIILPAIIGVIVVVTVFVMCISCLCCSCCPWYKRRHRGTIYGKVQTPGVVVIQPGAAGNVYQPYPPMNHQVNQMQYPSQPPPYSAEPYAQQAPYNPNYPQ